MTVAEFIQQLSKLPQDKKIATICSNGYFHYPSIPSIEEVTTDNAGLYVGLKGGDEIVVI